MKNTSFRTGYPLALLARWRDIDAQAGTGVTIRYSADEYIATPEGFAPPLVSTALDKLADAIIDKMYAGFDESLI